MQHFYSSDFIIIYRNIYRFIDDLCAFKNNEFKNNYDKIYRDEPELKKENDGPCKVSFLELSKRPTTANLPLSSFIKNIFIKELSGKIFYSSTGS